MSLVREDGTKVNVHRDRQRSQDVARDLELKYRLRLTTSRIAASAERGERPSERNIAERAGAAETKARRLERGVRAAAGASETEGEFVRRLHQYGIIAKPRFAAGRSRTSSPATRWRYGPRTANRSCGTAAVDWRAT